MSLKNSCPLYATEPTCHRHNQSPMRHTLVYNELMTIDHKEVLAVLLSIFFVFVFWAFSKVTLIFDRYQRKLPKHLQAS